jgi:hypothetical protein
MLLRKAKPCTCIISLASRKTKSKSINKLLCTQIDQSEIKKLLLLWQHDDDNSMRHTYGSEVAQLNEPHKQIHAHTHTLVTSQSNYSEDVSP